MSIVSLTSAPASFYDEKKDDAGHFAGKVCVDSRKNSPFVEVLWDWKHFRDDRDFKFINLPEWYVLNLWSDGIGTKVVLADVLEQYGSMAADLLAMWLDDTARNGWLPLVFTNVLDVNSIKTPQQFEAFKQLLTWLATLAKQQEVVVISWETASLGQCVSSPNDQATMPFNWSWAVLWVSHPKLKINPSNVKDGDYIVALKQEGFRSNGISKVRWAFEKQYGPNRYTDAPREQVAAALAPSVPYARAISEANGWFSNGEKQIDIHGIAHLSGWSFHSKFLEPILAKNRLSATLTDLYEIPEIALQCFERDGNMTQQELFTTRCCGQGMLVVVGSLAEAEQFIELVNQFGIEGKVAGQVTANGPGRASTLDIHSSQLN